MKDELHTLETIVCLVRGCSTPQSADHLRWNWGGYTTNTIGDIVRDEKNDGCCNARTKSLHNVALGMGLNCPEHCSGVALKSSDGTSIQRRNQE
jgi:hypothetical protein